MKKNKLIAVSLLITIFIVGFFVYKRYLLRQDRINNSFRQETKLPSIGLKDYKSENFDCTLLLPDKYKADESGTIIDFKNGDTYIDLARNDARGWDTVKKYLAEFDEKSQMDSEDILEAGELTINNHPATWRIENRGLVTYKMYYIYVDGWVYVFSTSEPSLYSDLDQIARSFRYTPN